MGLCRTWVPEHPASMAEENILVIRRDLFDSIGEFQGFCADAERYLQEFFVEGNNFFVERSRAENDASLKQLIPYCIFRHGRKVLHYVRGGSSGEKRLFAKGSIGIGGHINDGDLHLETFDSIGYRRAVEREIAEELHVSGGFTDQVIGLINDDSSEVGQVHLGVVHVVDLESDRVRPAESAITNVEFVDPIELNDRKTSLETWSQIALDALMAVQK